MTPAPDRLAERAPDYLASHEDILTDFAASGGQLGIIEPDAEEELLKREVAAEVMQAAGILATGRMDQVAVDLHRGIRTLVTPEQAAVPAVLEQMRRNWVAASERRNEQEQELKGIAEVFGLKSCWPAPTPRCSSRSPRTVRRPRRSRTAPSG
ncbi:hypothetical protein [Streptacidiphilus anmyonensis]|uniref:hypothetical protein n=1 Tax=Streptacidiphilus anmyonensis TaxID=405782 RepID=UPI0005A7319B|nr:hypothetical protein [Streptacidiphilus anmyonensis]